jgi:hypothetical protein
MRNFSILAAILIASAVLVPGRSVAESPNDLLIIANTSVSVDKADLAEVRSIFTKAKTALGGTTVFPINAKGDSDLRATFRQKVLKMPGGKEDSFWEEEKVKKGVEPPAEFAGTLKAVFSKKDSVSYIFRKDLKEGVTVKILAVVD